MRVDMVGSNLHICEITSHTDVQQHLNLQRSGFLTDSVRMKLSLKGEAEIEFIQTLETHAMTSVHRLQWKRECSTRQYSRTCLSV